MLSSNSYLCKCLMVIMSYLKPNTANISGTVALVVTKFHPLNCTIVN